MESPQPNAYTSGPYDHEFDAPLDESLFDDDRPLARPMTRLVGVIIDSLILVGAALPGVLVAVVGDDNGSDGMLGFGVALLVLGVVAVVGYQWWLLSRQGQTIGKRMLDIQIVDRDTGELLTFGRVVGMRSILPGLIGNIPYLGTAFWLIDSLMIFSDEHRTIHDRLANTVVVSNNARDY